MRRLLWASLWLLSSQVAAYGQSIDLRRPLASQLPSGAPFANTTADCTRLAARWSDITTQIGNAHQQCLEQHQGQRGARKGKECSYAACEHLHALMVSKQLRDMRHAQREQCRASVERYRRHDEALKRQSRPRDNRPAPAWNRHVVSRLQELDLQCRQPTDRFTPCNAFVSEGLSRIYGINDFKLSLDPPRSNDALANDISNYVRANPRQWTEVGPISSDSTLARAQALANQGYAVIAVLRRMGHGHVALVIPGSLRYSPSWGRDVPNSASMFLGRPNRTYIGKRLSSAFGEDKWRDVRLYYRRK